MHGSENVKKKRCDTFSFMLREHHRLRTSHNRVLRNIFEPKRDKVRGNWRKLDKEEHMTCTPHQVLSR
jgi:hypothetical protein